MPRQKKKQKKKYLVHGYPTGFETLIEEFTWAYSAAQAMRNIRIRLEKRHGLMHLFMGYCVVTEVELRE